MDKENRPKDSPELQPKPSLKLAWYGGTGIGLLFGIIMGTSTTPTVATVLGALTTLLAAILGLNDHYFNNVKAVRVGSFGFACVIGAYTGLYVRSHNLLSPSPEAMKAQYLRLGHSEEQALKLVTFKEFGFFTLPGNSANTPREREQTENQVQTVSASSSPSSPNAPPAYATPQIAQQHSSLLFGAEVDLSGCDELADTDSTLPLDEILNNFELTGGVWESFAIKVNERLNPAHQGAFLVAAKNSLCRASNDNTLQDGCESFDGIVNATNNTTDLIYPRLRSQLLTQPGTWYDIATAVDRFSWSSAEKLNALAQFKEIYCDANEAP